MKSWDGDLLAVLRTRAPYQANFHLRRGCSSQIEASDVRLAFPHRQTGLLAPMQRRSFQLYLRRLLADKCMPRIHTHEIVGTYGPPLLVLHPLSDWIGHPCWLRLSL